MVVPLRNEKGQWNKGCTMPMTEEHKRRISGSLRGKPSPLRGTQLSEEHRKKISDSHKGKKYMKGIPHTKEWNANISKAQLGKLIPDAVREKMSKARKQYYLSHPEQKRIGIEKARIANIGRKHTEQTKRMMSENNGSRRPEVRRKQSESAKRYLMDKDHTKQFFHRFQLKPNKKELLLSSILESLYPNEWKYVGDGQFIIDGLCPDFINCNGKKQIIEFFGEAFHDPLKTFKKEIRYRQTEKGRIESFAKYGYSTLIVWGRELRDLPALEAKIMSFVGKVLCNKQNSSEAMLPKKIGG
jgi:hypothetical protein